MRDQMLDRKAAPGRGTFNEADRSVEVCWSTGAAVKRYSYDEGYYVEELAVDRSSIRLDRFESMALLDSHDQYSMDSVLGTVVPGSVRIEGGKAYARIRLSRKPRAEEIFQDLKDGHRVSISVGYKIHRYEKTEGDGKKLPVIRAVDWEPLELSAVPIPADPGAFSRSQEEPNMQHPARRDYTDNRQETDAEIQQREQRELEQEVEDSRSLSLREARHFADELCVSAGARGGFVREQLQARLKRNMTKSQIRNEYLNILVDEQDKTPTFPHADHGRQDSQDTMRRMVANAILHRSGMVDKLEDGARQYREMSTLDLARDVLRQRGENAYGGASAVIQRSLHTTSDFPIILGDVGQQTIMTSYRKVQNTFQLIAHRNVVMDTRETKVIDIGSMPDLKLVLEHGEYTSGTMKEAAEGFTIAKYGRKFAVTEEMLLNDRLNAVMNAVAEWGRKAAKLEGDLVWNAIISNAKLKDGKGLFHADHNNLAAAGTALDKANLIAARKAFRQQKDIDGEPIDFAPKYLFTGSELEIDAQTIIGAAHVPTTVTDAIPQAIKSLVPIYEPRLDKITTAAWFLFAAEEDSLGRGLQYAYLNGNDTPVMKSQVGFDVDGIEFKIKHYFGVGVTDYRFAYQNPGL